jgi:ribosome-binding factor A
MYSEDKKMMRTSQRTRRIGEQIRRALAELIRDKVRDPRMRLISMTNIEVSRDLSYARVYVTLLGNVKDRAECVIALNHAALFLRWELGQKIHIRTVPRLEFRYDKVVEYAARLSALIDDTVGGDCCKKHRDSYMIDEVHPEEIV